MPARTLSMMRLRSSSATTPMITTTARPSGPAVSICSRKLMNFMFSRFNSSNTSRKCLVELAIRSQAQTQDDVEPATACISHQAIETGPARLRAGDPVRELVHDLLCRLLLEKNKQRQTQAHHQRLKATRSQE